MEENIKKMSCGGCGSDNFKVFSTENKQKICIECLNCKSVSTISPSSQLVINWEGEGCICFM